MSVPHELVESLIDCWECGLPKPNQGSKCVAVCCFVRVDPAASNGKGCRQQSTRSISKKLHETTSGLFGTLGVSATANKWYEQRNRKQGGSHRVIWRAGIQWIRPGVVYTSAPPLTIP